MTQMDITLPDKIAKKLEVIPNKNRFIIKALKNQLEQEKIKEIDRLLMEGYKSTKHEDKMINTEWENASFEKWD